MPKEIFTNRTFFGKNNGFTQIAWFLKKDSANTEKSMKSKYGAMQNMDARTSTQSPLLSIVKIGACVKQKNKDQRDSSGRSVE